MFVLRGWVRVSGLDIFMIFIREMTYGQVQEGGRLHGGLPESRLPADITTVYQCV